MDSAPHEQILEQLAWLANGTLAEESARTVRAHLSECAACRAQYEAQLRLSEAMREDGSGAVLFHADASFQKLLGRIDAEPESPSRTLGLRASRGARLLPERAIHWLAAAVIIEALGLGFAVWALQRQERTAPSYVTLSSPAPSYGSAAVVRAVFEPGLTLADLQRLLQRIGAHVIDGPTPAGVFTLGFANVLTDAQLEERAAALRADAHVRFAEPVSAPRGAPP